MRADAAHAGWHASAALGYPSNQAQFESVVFQAAPVMSFALAHRGTGALQPRIAVQVAGSAAGMSTYSWFGTIPDYSFDFALLSIGGELASRDHRASIAVSPGLAAIRWTQGPYSDIPYDYPAHRWNAVVPSIWIDGVLHVPLIAGLDLEPGLSFIASAPIHIDGTNEGRLLQVQLHVGLGF